MVGGKLACLPPDQLASWSGETNSYLPLLPSSTMSQSTVSLLYSTQPLPHKPTGAVDAETGLSAAAVHHHHGDVGTESLPGIADVEYFVKCAIQVL